MNRVILEGIVESDPTIRYFGYDHVRADFILCTRETFSAPRAGEDDRVVELRHMITAWGEVAQIIEERILEGQLIHLEGRLTYDKQTSRQGEVRVFPVVDCQRIEVLRSSDRFASAVAPPEVLDEELDWSQYAPDGDEDPMS